jgi:hypothetical protein
MLTLSDASYDTKEVLKWGGLIIAGLVVFIVIIRMLLVVKEMIFPTPPPKPTVLFGKLEPQVFPKNVTSQTLTYSINTLSGYLPALPIQAKVYTIQSYTPDLLGLSTAKQAVGQAGFTQTPTKLSDTLYSWTDPNATNISRRLTMNIVDYYFNLTTNYESNPTLTSGQGLPNQTNAINAAQGLLASLNSLPPDIDQTKTQTNLLIFKNGALATALGPSDAQVINVVFHQQDIDTLPIYYEDPNSSNINVLLGSNGTVLSANYIHQVATANFSTYPIKTVQQAFDELKQGKGYIATYYGGPTNIAINNVFLAYYIGSQPQQYLMPIIVFAKDNNFYAYVPAVTDEWINK